VSNELDAQVLADLSAFVAKELLDGKSEGLDADTPLLEWGVIDSMSLVQLVRFIAQRFGVEAPAAEIVAGNFATLRAMTMFVTRMRASVKK
jgi:acyl carrier protein